MCRCLMSRVCLEGAGNTGGKCRGMFSNTLMGSLSFNLLEFLSNQQKIVFATLRFSLDCLQNPGLACNLNLIRRTFAFLVLLPGVSLQFLCLYSGPSRSRSRSKSRGRSSSRSNSRSSKSSGSYSRSRSRSCSRSRSYSRSQSR